MAPFEKSMEMGMPFKQRKCLETRKDEVCSIRSKFPNKLPVIVERYIREKTLPLLDKTKFLVPFELTLGQFLCLLRNKIDLESTQALFLLVAEKSMSCMSSSMGEVYSHYRDPDGFLYITYASQEMFGAPRVRGTAAVLSRDPPEPPREAHFVDIWNVSRQELLDSVLIPQTLFHGGEST